MPTHAVALKSKRKCRGISLTPLIDVVFILLVFFMLATNFEKYRTVEMLPPAEGKPQQVQQKPDNLLVEVIGKDQYKVASETLTLADLQEKLVDKKNHKVLIKTTNTASLQDLIILLDMTGILALEKVSLLPYQEEKP